jgi:uncharacterized protein (TIGR00255 family)
MAIRSMTGYGTASIEAGSRRITVDLRSVNGRFLETQLRLPRLLQSAESAVREALNGRVGRGSLTLSVNLDDLGSSEAPQGGSKLKMIADELRREARDAGFGSEVVSLSDVLRWAGMRKSETPDSEPRTEDLKEPLLECIEKALVEFEAFRLREGAALQADLDARLERIEASAGAIPALAREHLLKVRETLETRIAEYLAGREIDPARIAQEIGHMSERLDVQEEMTRLSTHIAAFRKTLQEGGAVGKRIGFLLQEMLRETNTTGSKCQEAAITSLVISMKEDLEAIREQALNLE